MEAQKEILIAIMGATGTGKSTFINLVSGSKLGVGADLKSCTTNVDYSNRFQMAGRDIVLMDTPGFDDTNISDVDILKRISVHLSKTYEMKTKLSGVIYLHRISDNRMGGVSRRNFVMFRKLCGEDALKNVLIVTTMWSEVTSAVGEARERQLQTDEQLFKPVLDEGATMVRHDNTIESAQHILQMIVNNHPMPLRIQRELVDKKKDISKTGAGEELNKELAAMAKKHEEKLKQVEQEWQEALVNKDKEMRKLLEDERKELDAKMNKIEQDRNRLSEEYKAEKKRADEQVAKMMVSLDAEKNAREAGNREIQKLYRDLAGTSKQSAEQQKQLMDRIIELESRGDGDSGGCTIY